VTSYVPLDGRPFRLTMGLRPLDLARWFERDNEWEAQLERKKSLIATQRSEVVALTSRCDAAAGELLSLVSPFGAAPPADDHPLVQASTLVPDDLCLMEWDGEHWRLTGAVVCFPSRWALSDKIGTTLDEIHGPVPGYDADLRQPTTTFFHRLRSDRPMWRLNWTLLDNPELFQPRPERRPVTGDPGSWWFRVERQTLVRLPKSDAIVFTIRTYVTALTDLLESHPEAKGMLLTALDTAPAESVSYKGWHGVADALRPWLTSEDTPRR
jgi:hypothetical protein